MTNKIKSAIATVTAIATIGMASATTAAQSVADIISKQEYRLQEISYGGETFTATFYGPTGSPMANGEWPYQGAIAADPSYLPLGTSVWIEFPAGYEWLTGQYMVADTGGLVYGNIVDIYLDADEATLNELGRVTVTLYR